MNRWLIIGAVMACWGSVSVILALSLGAFMRSVEDAEVAE